MVWMAFCEEISSLSFNHLPHISTSLYIKEYSHLKWRELFRRYLGVLLEIEEIIIKRKQVIRTIENYQTIYMLCKFSGCIFCGVLRVSLLLTYSKKFKKKIEPQQPAFYPERWLQLIRTMEKRKRGRGDLSEYAEYRMSCPNETLKQILLVITGPLKLFFKLK